MSWVSKLRESQAQFKESSRPRWMLVLHLLPCFIWVPSCKYGDDRSQLPRLLRGLNEIMYVKHKAEQSILQQTSSYDYILNRVYIKKRTRFPLPTVPFISVLLFQSLSIIRTTWGFNWKELYLPLMQRCSPFPVSFVSFWPSDWCWHTGYCLEPTCFWKESTY